MQQLAAEQNVNLIIDDEMEGTVSLQLENTDLDQLLRAVAKIKQLELWQENGIYYLSKGEKHSANSMSMNLLKRLRIYPCRIICLFFLQLQLNYILPKLPK